MSCVCPDAPRDQRLGGRRADPDREVEALLDEVDHAIGELDVETKLRMLRPERRDRRRDMPLPERGRAGELQRAARCERACGDRSLGLFEIGQQLHGPLVERLAALGQRELAGRAIEQPHVRGAPPDRRRDATPRTSTGPAAARPGRSCLARRPSRTPPAIGADPQIIPIYAIIYATLDSLSRIDQASRFASTRCAPPSRSRVTRPYADLSHADVTPVVPPHCNAETSDETLLLPRRLLVRSRTSRSTSSACRSRRSRSTCARTSSPTAPTSIRSVRTATCRSSSSTTARGSRKPRSSCNTSPTASPARSPRRSGRSIATS